MKYRRDGPSTALRAIAAAIAILAGGAWNAYGEPVVEAARSIDARVAAILSLGPRLEGSASEAAAFDYISRSLEESGLEPRSSGFSDAVEGYSSSQIVEARIQGARPDELAIVVPVGTWARTNDPAGGAYGIALALDEAARIAAANRAGARLPISLRFVFLGAEKRGPEAPGREASLGSRTWIARQEGRTGLAVLYLNMEELPSRIAIRSAGRGMLAPFWFYDGTVRSLEDSGVALVLEGNRLQAYRLGLARDYGPSAPYLEAGIPAVELRGETPSGPQSGRPASMNGPWLDLALRTFAARHEDGFAETWDRHYFVFQLGTLSITLREGLYVVVLVASFALAASSFLIATIARRNAAARLLRRIHVLGVEVLALFVALALVFLAGKGIAALDSMVLGSPESWRLFPRVFALARILFSFLLFLALLSVLVERKMLTPNPYFYEFAAMVCLVVDSLVFSAFDLSASFYFIWALAFVEVSLAARSRWATLSAYFIMYAPLIVMTGELANRPELSTYGKLIAPSYLGLLSLSALTLPYFVFTASPLLFFAKRGAASRKRTAWVLACLALTIEAAALGYAFFFSPVEGPGRKDLTISELIDQDSGEYRIELSGLRRLGKGSIERGGARLDYESSGDRVYLRGEDFRRRVSLLEKSSPFLDRLDESLSLSFDEPPYSLDLSLESSGEMLIYDCNLPYKVAVDGRSVLIYPPVNPGPSLALSLTVPSSFGARLVVTARYLSSLEKRTQASGSPLEDDGLAVRASFDVGRGSR